MESSLIRKKFIEFFVARHHQHVPSSSLVPVKDPTLLFTNAGMNQFKSLFLQEEKRSYSRAVSIQKCMRVSGKHNDFDEVGKTDFHHTFFEMLGNFSFGDYFKTEAITYAWQLLTEDFQLPPEKLWITVYREDEEAYKIWLNKIGIPPEKIVAMDEKDNFWQMGETGPCGPCSEIHYDRGPEFGPEGLNGSNKRYIEIWNLVFMQFNRDPQGSLTPLPAPSIDTGMGMERLAMILQKKKGNYQTDLFQPIILFCADLAAINPENDQFSVDFKVIADHSRAITFLISDGVVPANEGRGYVLRRLIRRALKHTIALKISPGSFARICQRVIELMTPFYPELKKNNRLVEEVVNAEENRFQNTIKNGLQRFEELLLEIETKQLKTISGKELFKLFDTYGFPLDFARDLAMEKGISIDYQSFQNELEVQKNRSRQALKEKMANRAHFSLNQNYSTEFIGYDFLQTSAKIKAIFKNDKPIQKLIAPEEAILITDKTPFYAESGGQVADVGTFADNEIEYEIYDCQKDKFSNILHFFRLKKGKLIVGDEIFLQVDRERRKQTAIHHTATHLLQASLREIVGPHIRQAGSYVGPDKLRFDFLHFKPLSDDEITAVEWLINQKIRENLPLKKEIISLEEALKRGATALFDEKYGELVRLVSIENFSAELCGGTHLEATGEIGLFKIISESSSAAGIRRIEAVGGTAALHFINHKLQILKELSAYFNQRDDSLLDHLKKITEKKKENLANNHIRVDLEKLKEEIINLNGKRFLVSFIVDSEPKHLGEIADKLRAMKVEGIVLCTQKDNKYIFVIATDGKIFDAAQIANQIAKITSGRGGGKKEFAQAGGQSNIPFTELKKKIIEIVK